MFENQNGGDAPKGLSTYMPFDINSASEQKSKSVTYLVQVIENLQLELAALSILTTTTTTTTTTTRTRNPGSNQKIAYYRRL